MFHLFWIKVTTRLNQKAINEKRHLIFMKILFFYLAFLLCSIVNVETKPGLWIKIFPRNVNVLPPQFETSTHCTCDFDTSVINPKRAVVVVGEGLNRWQLPTMANFSSSAADQSFPNPSHGELTQVINLKSHRPERRWAALGSGGGGGGGRWCGPLTGKGADANERICGSVTRPRRPLP